MLTRKNMFLDSYCCPVCIENEEETLQHLFFDCSFSQACWIFPWHFLGHWWGCHLRYVSKSSQATQQTSKYEERPKAIRRRHAEDWSRQSLREASQGRMKHRSFDEAWAPKADAEGVFKEGWLWRVCWAVKRGSERKLPCTSRIFEEYNGWGVKRYNIKGEQVNSPINILVTVTVADGMVGP